MSFNHDINKQETEVHFSERREKSLPPPIIFNNNNVLTSPCQKHLDLALDSKLSFNEHVNQKMNKGNRIIGLMKRLYLILSRNQLFTIYKTFVRSHLDYADIIYNKPFNDSFKQKLEKVQYSAALIITRAIKGISREHLYKELGLEFLSDRRWYRKLVFFYNRRGASFGVTGEAFAKTINKVYNEVIQWRKNLFKVPSGKAGRSFISELSMWLDHFNRSTEFGGIALKIFMSLPCLLLQKPSRQSKAKLHV